MRGDAFAPLVPLVLGLLLRRRELGVGFVCFDLQDFLDRLDVGVLILDLRV